MGAKNDKRTPAENIPVTFAVQPLKPGEPAKDRATCGYCGLSWDDGKITGLTPAPAGRCPFEPWHKYHKRANRLARGILAEVENRRQAQRIRDAAPKLLAALREVETVCKAGVIEVRETGKPTWLALDHLRGIARAAIAKAEGKE